MRKRNTQGTPLYAESWICLSCGHAHISFHNWPIRPETTACPWCHFVGDFMHWRATLPAGTTLADIFPWPGSACVDAQDAQEIEACLALSAPGAREAYARTGIAPWSMDARPNPPRRYNRRDVTKAIWQSFPQLRLGEGHVLEVIPKHDHHAAPRRSARSRQATSAPPLSR